MKIQHLAVVFIIIIMPITIIMTATLQSRIKTITLQNQYTTKLTDATYDAIKAFQINTVNNRYSSISDSKIRDIEAAINTFFTSLGTAQNLRKEDLQEHVPALVFTLYDGYYIYSKYDNAYPENNGQVITNSVDTNTNYGLKPYIYYSRRYAKGGETYVVNYTLDNAITVFGKVKNNGAKYGTISGYLINPSLVTSSNMSGNVNTWYVTYNGIRIEPEILTEHLLFADGNFGDYDYVIYNNQKIYKEPSSGSYFWYQNYKKTTINNEPTLQYVRQRTINNRLFSTSAVEYYINAKNFSAQVKSLMGNITQADSIDENGNAITNFSIQTGTNKIFDFNSNNDPMLTSSTFNQNRMEVIRRSIETNLQTAIQNYQLYSSNGYTYQLPVLNEVDWEKISTNVSLTSFLQGIPIGYKFFNNYCVISNENNEENIHKDNVYIVTNSNGGQREYHYPGCSHLLSTSYNYTIEQSYSNLSFLKQRVRLAENDYWHFYPQSRGVGKIVGLEPLNITTTTPINPITACYYCIVNAANVYPADDIITGKVIGKNSNWEDIQLTGAQVGRLENVRKYYLQALARERYDLYQTNMVSFNN